MPEPGHDDLTRQLFWRDEILQAMYWMHGEGLGAALSARALAGLLDASEEQLGVELRRLVAEGYLEPVDEQTYRLTSLGEETGRHSFVDEFADLTRSAHGACGPGCDCHRHPALASACRATRA